MARGVFVPDIDVQGLPASYANQGTRVKTPFYQETPSQAFVMFDGISWDYLCLSHAIESNCPRLFCPYLLCVPNLVRSLHAHLTVEIEHGHDVVLSSVSCARHQLKGLSAYLEPRMRNIAISASRLEIMFLLQLLPLLLVRIDIRAGLW